MTTGRIFDLRRYSIHDGPGIRTAVFFKGCPLRCEWCHNPEGVDPRLELMPWPSRCSRCGSCVKACPAGAIRLDGSGPASVDPAACAHRSPCGASPCADACVYDALQPVGREATAESVVSEVSRDRVFFDQSGGGVTLTGGEPLLQPEFLLDLLDRFARLGLPAAVDTSGYAPAAVVDAVAAKAALVLFDLKIMDEAAHRARTGVSNRVILDNLARFAAGPGEVRVRVPLVAGVNDDDGNVTATIDRLVSLRTVRRVGLLSYHAGGVEKARRLGSAVGATEFAPPSEDRLLQIHRLFASAGFEVTLGD